MVEPGNNGEILMSMADMVSHPFDGAYSVNNGYEGGKFAKPIHRWLNEHGVILPNRPKLLGLGAGVGNPECALADNLEIPYEDVTLIDKNPDILKNRIFSTDPEDLAYYLKLNAKPRHPINYLVNRGIFHFIENPDQRDFSIVTAIGLEYLLNDPKYMEYFIRLLPNVLLPNAFVCIYPESPNNPEDIWTDVGFSRVQELGPHYNYADSLLYVYSAPKMSTPRHIGT